MASTPEPPRPMRHPAGQFATTHWSMVLAARDQTSPEARAALAALCGTYWYPLYAYLRRQGYPPDQSQDLTQEFFAQLLEKDFLKAVDPGKGKFRSFLLAACKHFLANQRARANAQKRGGGRDLLPIDFQEAEERFHREPAHTMTPDKLFERRWVLTLLDRVLAQLKDEFARARKSPLFERLKASLMGEKGAAPYAQVAEELGMTEGAVKVAVHRLRNRYRELLRAEIARTLDDAGDIDEEIGNLFNALGFRKTSQLL